jgi:hypothetical protein
VRFSSRSWPRLCNRANFATLAVQNPYDSLVTNFTLLLRPSTAPAVTCPRARNQFVISGRWFRILRALFLIDSSRERITRPVPCPRTSPPTTRCCTPKPLEFLAKQIRTHRPNVVLQDLRQLYLLLVRQVLRALQEAPPRLLQDRFISVLRQSLRLLGTNLVRRHCCITWNRSSTWTASPNRSAITFR